VIVLYRFFSEDRQNIEEDENVIDLINNNNCVPNRSDSNDNSLKFNQRKIREKFSILQGRFHVQRTFIFGEYENVNKTKICY